jgi:hypothetical protein
MASPWLMTRIGFHRTSSNGLVLISASAVPSLRVIMLPECLIGESVVNRINAAQEFHITFRQTFIFIIFPRSSVSLEGRRADKYHNCGVWEV